MLDQTLPRAPETVPSIEHAGHLEDLNQTPAYLMPHHESGAPQNGKISCSYCGVGDGGNAERVPETTSSAPETGAKLQVYKELIRGTQPTTGCVKLRLSTMRQRAAYPIHVAPSVLDPVTGRRRPISYEEAISRLADLVLAHKPPRGRTLIYASGQLDYFTIFGMQEVFRLLGTRNLTGNAEHCLNAGAVHNEILTGQEGPFLTINQGVAGPNRFYLFNGWNGFISHPPAFKAITSRPDFDGFLIEVMVTESAKAVAKLIGKDRIVLIRPRTDPHLALAVAHQILTKHPEAVSTRFVGRFSNPDSFAAFSELAREARFAPERVAERIAPEPAYAPVILRAIEAIALRMADPHKIPINIPSVGLSQTSGVVAHCLWGDVMAMVGKYGLNADGTPAGGTLRLPGQINAESEVQGLSRKYFMGRIPMTEAADAAKRMGLPEDAYAHVVQDSPRAALDYSEPTPGERELFLCFGTQFEANMMGRRRWLEKMEDPNNTLVVVDPIPDSYSEQHAALIIPSPPHPATTKLYQNGEWKLTLSVPQKRAAPETRSDPTIIYDLMAEVTRRVKTDPKVAADNADLARHAASGYLDRRFSPPEPGREGGLTRIDGEVSRPELWTRIHEYMEDGRGPLYCRPEHADGRRITWADLLERGFAYYGGVGETRFVLHYDDPDAHPFRDVFRRPGKFKFFVPTEADLAYPEGVTLNSGRSSLSDDRERIAFATSTFNSGKATPIVGMPDEHPLFVSKTLAEKHAIASGDRVMVTNRENGEAMELVATVTDRLKGDGLYMSFHKSRAQMERGFSINDVTSHIGRCAYSGQTQVKASPVVIEKVLEEGAPAVRGRRLDCTTIDPKVDLPVWDGQNTPLYVTDVLQETHDVYTLRFQGDPLCRFAYLPGQFCSFVLNVDGKKVVRSYSISSTPTRPFVLETTIKRVPGGLVSNWLADHLKVGDRVEVSGPKGKFHLVPGKVPRKILFLAAGSGITPLMSMARWLCDVSADVDIRFFNSVKTPEDIIFRKEIEMMTTRYRQFQPIVITTSRGRGEGWTGLTGRISRTMLEVVCPDLRERTVYLCGPDGFMEAAKTLLKESGFDMARFHAESFGGVRTSIAGKQAPIGPDGRPASGDGGTALAEGPLAIEFARAGKTLRTDGKTPLLDLAESLDVEIGYACRMGNCGDCKVKLLSGEVEMASHDGLDQADRDARMVLSCVSLPRSSCVVDA